MIYICADLSGKLPQSETFAARGLQKFTMGRISDVVCFGKADSNQLAYSGYKDNIEAFLYATAMKHKVNISAGHFPIPSSYTPTTPLPFPRTIFKLAKKPTQDFIDKMKGGLEKYGIEDVFVGKGDPSYIVSKPDFGFFSGPVASISLPRGPVIEATSQLISSISVLRIYQCVDLFLRTNTYSYKPDDVTVWPSSFNTERGRNKIIETQVNGFFWREGYSNTGKIARTSGEEMSAEEKEKARVENDTTPHLKGEIQTQHTVLVAKPSKMPASSSYGPPSGVPTSSGVIFPFFPGMLAGDTAGFRGLISSLFFRNLGSQGKDVRDSFKDFRADMGSFPTTSAGIILTHVLKGVELALQTQTQLFLLIEEETYHGFCLLGEFFSIFAHGIWHRPLSPEDLVTELKEIRSHSSSLSAVRDILGKCVDGGGNAILVEEDELRTSCDLADILSRVNISDTAEDDLEKLKKEIRTLSFPSRYRTFKPEFIAESVRLLTVHHDQPFPRSLPIFISADWSKMGSKEYKVFASFGPRSFSFRNAVGTEILVPGAGEEDPMVRRNEAGKLIYPRLLVGEKSISACLVEWEALKTRGMIKMDMQERAQGSRNHVFVDKSKDVIWGALKEARIAGSIRTGTVATIPEKRSVDVAFGSADHDSIVW
jgi:hypothetical protein